jgi:hypothetical protein
VTVDKPYSVPFAEPFKEQRGGVRVHRNAIPLREKHVIINRFAV